MTPGSDWVQPEVIRSSDNSIAKRIRSLRQRKTRETERAFVVEGVRAVEDALLAGGRAQVIILREDARWDWRGKGSRPPIREMERGLFNELAETDTPQPILSIFSFPEVKVVQTRTPFVVVADGLRDPGNLGTLIRSAAGAGATEFLLTPGSVDPFNPKVVRAGMGAHFRLPIGWLGAARAEELKRHCPVRVLAEADGIRDYTAVDYSRASVIVVGSEAFGSAGAGDLLDAEKVSIPMENAVESLNAAVAGSILLFEVARQRRLAQADSTKG